MSHLRPPPLMCQLNRHHWIPGGWGDDHCFRCGLVKRSTAPQTWKLLVIMFVRYVLPTLLLATMFAILMVVLLYLFLLAS